MIGLKLREFRANVADLARPNRFEVEIYPPSIYSNIQYNEGKIISWLAQKATIPERRQGEITIKYHGMELKLPGDYEKENLTISFLNSYGWEGRSFFEKWMEDHIQTTNIDNSRRDAHSIIIDSKIIIKQLGRTNKAISSYVFYNVFPITISSIDLSMDSNDSIETFDVTFAYSYWSKI